MRPPTGSDGSGMEPTGPRWSRPGRIVVVAGTATEIGKTWTTAQLARRLRTGGHPVVARKPAQSFTAGSGPTDADHLAAATGEDPQAVCPAHRWYEAPLAPPMAAEVLGRPPVRLADLVAELTWPIPPPRIALVETVGGVRSPLAADGDSVALVEAVGADLVILVADAGLGTINAVRLAGDALRPTAVPVVVFLNRFDGGDDLHRRNAAWLADHGVAVRTDIDQVVADISA